MRAANAPIVSTHSYAQPAPVAKKHANAVTAILVVVGAVVVLALAPFAASVARDVFGLRLGYGSSDISKNLGLQPADMAKWMPMQPKNSN